MRVRTLLLLLFLADALNAQTVNLTSLVFSAQFAGPSVSQTLSIASSAGSTSFTASSNVSWLKLGNGALVNVNTVNGATPATLTVTVDPTGLNPGPYSGSISIYGTGNSVIVPVSLTVSAITVSPAALDFAYALGGSLPAAQSVALSGQALGFTAVSNDAWLRISPATGLTPAALTVQLDGTVVPSLAAATYTGAITITPAAGSLTTTPVSVPVTLRVTTAPPVIFSAASLALAHQSSGANNQPQILTLSTTASQDVGFSITSSADPNPSGRASWAIVNPTSGVVPKNGSSSVAVSYDTSAALPSGTYNGKITVLTPGAAPAQKDIPLQLTVSAAPALVVPGAPLKFVYELGGSAPAAQNVTVQSTNAAPESASGQIGITLQSSANWLVVPATATTGTPFAVSVDPAGLPAGSYSASAIIQAAASNSPQTLNVSLTVSSDAILQSSVSSLSFPYQIGQTSSAQLSQTVSLTSNTGAPLDYTTTASATSCGTSWLTLSGAVTGATNGSFTVVVNPAGLGTGTCDGSVTVSATNAATGVVAIGSPVRIPVTLYVSSTPSLVVSPMVLGAFTANLGGPSPAPQTVNLYSTSSGAPLTYTVTPLASNCGSNWLFVSKTSGTTPDTLSISAALTAALTVGTCSGTVRIAAAGPGGTTVANSPVLVPISFQVTSGTLSVSASALSFTATLGSPAPAAQTLTVSSTGSPVVYTALAANPGAVPWLSVTPSSGLTASSGTLSVTVDGSRLTAGTYQGTVNISSPHAANSPLSVTVSLIVNAGTISAAPASMSFTQAQGGQAPAAQKVTVATSPGTIQFTATCSIPAGGNWLSVSSPNGGVVQVSVAGGSLAIGTYSGTVTIAAAAATGSPIAIPVTLNVVAPRTLSVSSNQPVFDYVIGTAAPALQTIQLTANGGATPFTASVSGNAAWLQVSPSSGTTPAGLTISANPQGLAAGTYTGIVSIGSPYSLAPMTLTATLAVAAVPQPVITAIKNAASWQAGAICPGENIVIGGTGIGPSTLAGAQMAANGGLSAKVAETQVLFDGVAAPIIYAWATQTSVMVPHEVAGRATTSIRVVYRGVTSEPAVYNFTAAAPGIYTLNQAGSGPPVVLNLDGSAPIARGSAIAFYMTGEGATSPPSLTGTIASLSTGLNKPVLPVTAKVGGVPAKVAYYGSAPGAVYGVMQVNIDIPPDAPAGVQSVVVTVGTVSTPEAVTITLR